MIDDILKQLRIPDAEVVHTGFYRPNLDLDVVQTADEEERDPGLIDALRRADGTGIIYFATVKAVNELEAGLPPRACASPATTAG